MAIPTFECLEFQPHTHSGEWASMYIDAVKVVVRNHEARYSNADKGEFEVNITSPDGSISCMGWMSPRDIDNLFAGLKLAQIGVAK